MSSVSFNKRTCENCEGGGPAGTSFHPSSFRICISDTRGGKIRAEASLVDSGVRHARSFARGDKNFQEKLSLHIPSPPLLSRASLVICPVNPPRREAALYLSYVLLREVPKATTAEVPKSLLKEKRALILTLPRLRLG